MIRKIVKLDHLDIKEGPSELLGKDINSISDLGWNIISISGAGGYPSSSKYGDSTRQACYVLIEKDDGTYR